MEPPTSIGELVRRLDQAAQPLYGRTRSDVLLAARILQKVGNNLPSMAANWLAHALRDNLSTLYHTEPEDNR